VLSDVITRESKIVNPSQDAKKIFHIVIANSDEYKIVENSNDSQRSSKCKKWIEG